MTKGEYRVGIDFNPSADPKVTTIKQTCADMIDFMDEIAGGSDNPEIKRLAALCQTHLEDAAMWGVKAITKPAQPE